MSRFAAGRTRARSMLSFAFVLIFSVLLMPSTASWAKDEFRQIDWTWRLYGGSSGDFDSAEAVIDAFNARAEQLYAACASQTCSGTCTKVIHTPPTNPVAGVSANWSSSSSTIINNRVRLWRPDSNPELSGIAGAVQGPSTSRFRWLTKRFCAMVHPKAACNGNDVRRSESITLDEITVPTLLRSSTTLTSCRRSE